MTLAAPGRLRVALVGAGYFSRFHLLGWSRIADAEVVAICDQDIERARVLAGEFGISAIYTDLETMLDTITPTLLDIVTPPLSHRQILESTLARGVPAICQKPFCTNYEEARDLARRAQDAGRIVVVHENFRFMPWFREAKRLLDTGTLGRPHGITFRLRPGDGQGPDAYLDRQPYFQVMPRLLVVETAIHFIDTFRYLLGEPEAVYARLRRLNPAIRAEDAAFIHFDFAGDAVGVFDGNRLNDHVAANPRRTMGEMWLEGSAGVLRLDGDARLWWKPHHGAEREHVYDRGNETEFGGGACGFLQRHVAECLLAGRPPENLAQEYLENLRIQEAVYRSHRTGRRIVLRDFEPELQDAQPPML